MNSSDHRKPKMQTKKYRVGQYKITVKSPDPKDAKRISQLEKRERLEAKAAEIQEYNDQVEWYNRHVDYIQTGIEEMETAQDWLSYQAGMKLAMEAIDVIGSDNENTYLLDTNRLWKDQKKFHEAFDMIRTPKMAQVMQWQRDLDNDVAQSLYEKPFDSLNREQKDQVGQAVSQLEEDHYNQLKRSM